MNKDEIKAKLEALEFNGIAWNKETKELEDVKVKAFVFMDGDTIRVSSEDGNGLIDYYGEFRGGDPYINPILEEFAKSVGGFWEWRDPSCIGLYF